MADMIITRLFYEATDNRFFFFFGGLNSVGHREKEGGPRIDSRMKHAELALRASSLVVSRDFKKERAASSSRVAGIESPRPKMTQRRRRTCDPIRSPTRGTPRHRAPWYPPPARAQRWGRLHSCFNTLLEELKVATWPRCLSNNRSNHRSTIIVQL